MENGRWKYLIQPNVRNTRTADKTSVSLSSLPANVDRNTADLITIQERSVKTGGKREMKVTKILMGLALSLTFILMGILAVLPLTACKEAALCCGKIEDFRSQFEYICPQCPDAGTRLYYKIVYTSNGKPGCTPGTEGCQGLDTPLMGIKNITTNTGVSANFVETAKGVMENPSGGMTFLTDQICTLRLIASGNTGCPTETKDITIKVVEPGMRHRLCFPHNDLPQGQGFWTGKTQIFGTGVVIDYIQNPNPFRIKVTLNGITTPQALAQDETSNLYHHKSPNGTWSIEIPNSSDYQNQVTGGKKVCVIVYLTCKCP
jgi:hypothetical protein